MKKSNKYLLYSSIITFTIACIWIYFFKCNVISGDMRFFYAEVKIQWIPGSSLFLEDGSFSFANLVLYILNVMGFMMFGFLLGGAFKKKRILVVIIISILFSIFIETLQGIFAFGSVEFSDVICNGLGGFLGVFIYHKLENKMSDLFKNIFYLIITIISSCCIIIGIGLTIHFWPQYIEFV